MENKIKTNAEAFEKLLTIEDYFCLAYKGKGFVKNKIDYLHLLERAFDENKLVFRLRKGQKGKSRIESELFLQTEVDAEQIYVYLDSVDGADSEYFCRSFVANPDFDRTVGQIKLTTLWQEKKNLLTGESTVLYRFKDFSPEDLNK